MATTKRYQLLKDLQNTSFFDVNGSIICVTFKGGIRRPELIRGRFTTDDPDLQAVMEADNGFNVEFKLERTFETEDKAPVVTSKKEVVITKTTDEKTTTKSIEVIDGPAIVDYPEVTTVKDARQKLLDLYPDELYPSQLPNKAAVLSKAKGKNITFSNLA
jgi:subtilase family serine protease